MKADTENLKPRPSSGFTLLELMVAMVILTIAMSIAFQAFSGTIHAWKRGTEVVDGIKHGDFAMNQLASALDSTLYFFNPRKTYAFTIERGNAGSLPADTISFVTMFGVASASPSPASMAAVSTVTDTCGGAGACLFTGPSIFFGE
ncbi:MAG: type II secretion system GspH family protein, partial [Kiritimatiellales bacterium]|nr:type II secretion system GspH family protein [Kiritimatiellales bacterium]